MAVTAHAASHTQTSLGDCVAAITPRHTSRSSLRASIIVPQLDKATQCTVFVEFCVRVWRATEVSDTAGGGGSKKSGAIHYCSPAQAQFTELAMRAAHRMLRLTSVADTDVLAVSAALAAALADQSVVRLPSTYADVARRMCPGCLNHADARHREMLETARAAVQHATAAPIPAPK